MLRGGIVNPIVPVSADLKTAERLVDLFCVDLLFGVGEDSHINAFKARHQYLIDPHNFRDSILYEDWHTERLRLAYLDVISTIEQHWQAEIRHKPTEFRSNAALVRWIPEDTLANLFSLLFGFYPTDLNLLDDFDAAFLNGLKAHEVRIERDALIDGHLARRVSPIACTADGLIGGNRRPSGDGVYIGDSDNFEDLVTFWNLRAAGGALTFFSPMHSARMRTYIEEHLQDLDERHDGTPNRPRDSIIVYYMRDHEADARAFADAFQTARPKVLYNVTTNTWNGLNIRPSFFHFDYQKVLANTEESFNRPVVTFALPDKKFLPKDAPNTPDWQHLVVSLNFYGGMKGVEHTLRPPFLRQLNEFYSRAMAFDPWALRIEPEGIALIIDTRDTSAQLYPLGHRDLLLRIFELAGVKADRSQPGRLALRIIANMKEYMPLEACRVFKIRGVRLLLKTMRVEDERPWEAAMKTIAEEQFGKFKELYIESRRERELKPHDALRFLVEKRILKPRLKLRPTDWLFRRNTTYKCEECGLAFKHPDEGVRRHVDLPVLQPRNFPSAQNWQSLQQ